MSSILITTLGSYGDINPYVGLGKELLRRGHAPVIATSSTYRPYIEAEGIGFHPTRPELDPERTDLIERIMDPFRGTEYLLKELIIPAIRESYEDLESVVGTSDLIITHPITFAGPLVAARHRLPWVSTVLAPMSFFSRHDLPVFPPAPWMKRLEGLGGWASTLLVGFARAMAQSWTRPIAALREELGLPPNGSPLFEGQHSPSLVLALFSPLLGTPQPDWPPNVRVTGHVFHTGPDDRRLDGEVATFLERGEPPVVFTLGSAAVHAPGEFFRETLAAVAEVGCRAVLLTGIGEANEPGLALPGGVLVARNQPYDLLFPRAAAIVHHGGIGTTAQGMRAGRPMLVVPFAHDQPDNADRVRRLGIAEVLPARRYSAKRAAPLLRRLLGEGRYHARAAEVGDRVRRERGVENAADLIETQLGHA